MALSWSLTGSFSSCLRKQTQDISLQSLYRSQSVTRKTEYWKANWPLHWRIILKAFLTSAIYSYTEIAYTFFHAQRKNIYYFKLKKLILKMLNINFNAKQTSLMSASILGSTSSIQKTVEEIFLHLYTTLHYLGHFASPPSHISFATNECDASTPPLSEECPWCSEVWMPH